MRPRCSWCARSNGTGRGPAGPANRPSISTPALNREAISTQAFSHPTFSSPALNQAATGNHAVSTQAIGDQTVTSPALNCEIVSTQAVSAQAIGTPAVSAIQPEGTSTASSGDSPAGRGDLGLNPSAAGSPQAAKGMGAGATLTRRAATTSPPPTRGATTSAAGAAESAAGRGPTPLMALQGWDTAGGLRRVGGNVALYLRLLRTVLHTQADADRRLEQALAQQDLAEAERIVHTIKGVAANLGAIALADAAACLDAELRHDSCPPAPLQHFREQLQTAFAQLREALTPPTSETASDATAAGSNSETRPLRDDEHELLQRLEACLAACDGEALELIELQRQALIAMIGAPGYEQVRTPLLLFDFASAHTALRQGMAERWAEEATPSATTAEPS